jgi:MFS family permease
MLSRNVVILSLCQALASSGVTLVIFIGGILGPSLAPTPVLATLSVTSVIIGTALSTIPASLVMKRFGRRRGMMMAACLAAVAAAGAAYAVAIHHFLLFCTATLFIGFNVAFVQQYRFAAAESTPSNPGRAISFVLLGGMAAGFLGPEIGIRTKYLLEVAEYAGSFASIVVLYLLVAILLSFLQDTRTNDQSAGGEERPLRQLLALPTYRVAILAGVVAYGVMSFIMTATPISMHWIDGHSLDSTGWVIESHIIAMYLPSLFTGSILPRLGAKRVMTLGVWSMAACMILTLIGRGLPNYWIALVLLGLGWNFLFVGATVLLTETYRPAERFKAQAFNDFLIFGVQALASLSAGVVIFRLGWNWLILLTLPALVGISAALYFLRMGQAGKITQQIAPAD